MNSTAVNRHIRAFVWPILRDHKFSAFTSRSAWRQHESGVDVVNFQSFNRSLADAIGCSTFSFAINLGVSLACVPSDHPPAIRGGAACPEEYACHLRRRVHSTLPTLPQYPDIWPVNDDEAECEATVQAAALELVDTALPWFDAFRDSSAVYRMLRDEDQPPDPLTQLPGNPGSPIRNIVTGYVALNLGEQEQAASHLREALAKLRAFEAQLPRGRTPRPSMVPPSLQATVEGFDSQS